MNLRFFYGLTAIRLRWPLASGGQKYSKYLSCSSNTYSVRANDYCPKESLNCIPADVAARYGLYRHGVIGYYGWELTSSKARIGKRLLD